MLASNSTRRLFPDVWFFLGVGSMLWLLWRRPWVGLLLLSVVGANFAVTAAAPLGDVRYAYALFPLFFFAAACALGEWRNRVP